MSYLTTGNEGWLGSYHWRRRLPWVSTSFPDAGPCAAGWVLSFVSFEIHRSTFYDSPGKANRTVFLRYPPHRSFTTSLGTRVRSLLHRQHVQQTFGPERHYRNRQTNGLYRCMCVVVSQRELTCDNGDGFLSSGYSYACQSRIV